MAKDCCVGGFGERGETEVSEASVFKGGGALYKALGFGVHAEAQPKGACAAFGRVCGYRLRHGLAPALRINDSGSGSLYVQWENKAMLALRRR
jgi:hypothetical protein